MTSGKDLSSVWASFAPPPPPASPGPDAIDSRRRSTSHYAEETRERARGDSLPPSSFSPAPDRPVSRSASRTNSHPDPPHPPPDRPKSRNSQAIDRPVSRNANVGGSIRQSMPPPSSSAGMGHQHQPSSGGMRPMSQDMHAGAAWGNTLLRSRHDSAPVSSAPNQQMNGYGSYAPPAGYAPPQQPIQHQRNQTLSQPQPPPAHLQRSNSAQGEYAPPPAQSPHHPVAYGSPYPQPGMYPAAGGPNAGSPVLGGQHAFALPPQQQPHPQQQQQYYAAPQQAPVAYGYTIINGHPVPIAQAPQQYVAYQPQAVPQPGVAPHGHLMMQQQLVHGMPQQVYAQPPMQMANAAPVPNHAVAPVPAPAAAPSGPEQYAIPAIMAPPGSVPSAAPTPFRPASKRPLPQPARSFSLDHTNAAQRPVPQAGAGVRPAGHAPSASVASTVGSVRRNLPQPPPGATPVLPTSGGSALPPNLSGTLNRTESMRMAAEALMARGPPKRNSVGYSSMRNRAAMPSSFSSGSGSDQNPAIGAVAEEESGNSSFAPASAPTVANIAQLASSQSDPTSYNSDFGRNQSSMDSLTQSVQAITMQNFTSQPSSSSSPAPAATSPQADSPESFAPPDRPRSRGAQHSIRQPNHPGRPTPNFVQASPPQPAQPATFKPQPQSPLEPSAPRVQVEAARAPVASPAPARYQAMTSQAPPAIVENPVISVQQARAPPPVAPPQIVEPPRANERAAPPPSVPSISLPGDDEDDDGGPSIPGISISVTDDSAFSRPAPPSISISGGDDEDAVPGAPVVTVSHSDDGHSSTRSTSPTAPGVAQRATSGYARPPPDSTADPASASMMGSGATCGGCRKWIGGRVVQAMGLSWHPQCFRCSHCGEHLEHFAFYEHEGRPYCHFDYHELFSRRCFHCRTPIVDERFISIDDEQLGKRYYHDLHFFCANCGDPFVDPKAAAGTAGADEQALVADEQGIVQAGGKAFVVIKGYPYCEKCHVNLHHPRCKGCKKPITDDLITALKGKWHPHCFVCESCHRPFEGERFFEKNGKAWDEECYKIMLRNMI